MAKPHILIVDDDVSIRSLLSNLLDRSGYRVSVAGDGIEGLEVFHADQPEVLLVDLRMPRMNGETFIAHVLDANPDAVILVLTGHGTIRTAVELMQKGVYYILTKPCGVDQILFMVEKALRQHQLKERSRELEKRLEISERLAMIGKLAAGVAHELNSPLDGVMRFVRLTIDSLEEGTEVRGFQEDALLGLRRMSDIVRDLLTFSRNIAMDAEEEGLEKQLHEAAKQVLASRPDKEVEVVFELAVPDVSVPRGMFQVFSNLIRNALDVSKSGDQIGVQAGIRDGELFVAVRDQGPGIPKELQERVFEPFFTTKAPGEGTGLGLSIVARIMERYGGAVVLDSREGKGTTVNVFLPEPSRARTKERKGTQDVQSVRTSR